MTTLYDLVTVEFAYHPDIAARLTGYGEDPRTGRRFACRAYISRSVWQDAPRHILRREAQGMVEDQIEQLTHEKPSLRSRHSKYYDGPNVDIERGTEIAVGAYQP